MQVTFGLSVKKTVLLKELKIPQRFWVKKDKKSLMELMALVVGFEMDVLREVAGVKTKIPVW